MLGDCGSYLVKGLSLGDLQQFPRKLRGGVVGVCFERRLKSAVKLFPAGGQDGLSLGGKGFPGTGECGGDSLVHMGRGHGAQQLAAHKGQQFLFPLGQPVKAFLHKFHRRDNGVVVAYLFAVQHPAKLRGQVKPRRKGKQRPQAGHKAFRRWQHIIGQILAVGAGIGQQLLFIKLLGIVKGLLGGKSKQPVCLPLQGGEVIEAGRLLRLFLPCYRHTNGLRRFTGGFQGLGVVCVFHAFTGRLHAARRDLDDVVFLFLEAADLGLPVNQHFEGRRLDTAHGQGLVVEDGEQPGRVDPHQPIRLRPAKGRLIQVIIIGSRFQMGKALLDGRVLHAGNPKALKRFLAARHLVDKTENQFPLAPGVGGAHKAGDIGALHQRTQGVKLLFLIVGNDVLPFLRQNRQVVIAPFFETLVISPGVGKGNKVADTPAHQIAVPLHVAVLFLVRADHARNAAGYAWFLCNY